ncbi:MAG TPA: cell wall hydrolase [Dokdonella sp.]|nr:cell wall hydrolase [Dokdonella sp.]HPG94070.1 cell wall hydrolase [Dokdonella sp.]HPN79443.1 cell wall hydrolase [Dokdonella sp.]
MKLAWLLWLASVLPQQEADRTCLAAMVYLEARSETQLGQAAVAEVAMRRREDGRWGDDICEVVSSRMQFAISTTNKNYLLRNPVAWDSAWKIADHALQMWDLPVAKREFVVPNADHFVAEEHASPAWMKGQPLAVIGAHSFYRVN